ncbi:MAG: TonB-dependent siderophore receptor [Pseudomonadota bacterium]|nr:TonB-dependent siderophore receptor [Pseudomonadota bacterium]
MTPETSALRRRPLPLRAGARRRLLTGCATLALASAAAFALAPSAARAQTADAPAPEPVTLPETDPSGETYRLSPILVDSGAPADDDADSFVAHELWVGGKVATSLLDTPASVSVVTQAEIERRDAETVEEVLSYTPGVITDYYGSDDRNDYFLVRGFQASTYRDGLTLGTMRGVREEPYAFERVEIIKGSNSTLFGPAEPGGSINYVTKTPKFRSFGEGYIAGGSFGQKELGFDVGDTIDEAGTLAFRVTGKVKESALDYDNSDDDERFLMGGLTWAPTSATSLTVVVDHLDRDGTPNSGGYPLDRTYDRDDFFGEPDFNYHDVERTTASAMLEHDFGGGLSLRSSLRYSDLEDDFGYVYLFDYAGRPGTVVDRYYFGSDATAQELIGNVIGQYDVSFGTVDSSTLVGAEYRDASTTSSSFYGTWTQIDLANPVFTGAPTGYAPYTETNNDHTTTSLFLQQNLSFYDRVIVTGGVRHDWLELESAGVNSGTAFDDSDSFSETSFRGAVTWKVTDDISTYASYVESVATPSIGVEPERGEQYEIGAKWRPSGINALFSASIFDLTKRDITIAVVQGDGSITRQTVGETRARGLELEGKAEITESFSLLAGYTYLDTEILKSDPVRGVDVEGNRFASTPNHMASVWANYTVKGTGGFGDMSFGLGARYTGSYYFNQQNDSGQADDAVLFDLSFGYQLTENAEFRLNVTNLLDEQHVVGSGTADYYNPGRRITASLRYVW